MHVNSFKELEVYLLARKTAKEIFKLSKSFPQDELYALTDQIRRSSRSIGAQIAEAWAKRRYARHFISKLTDANGEQQETQHWLETAWDCEYISDDERESFVSKYSEIGKRLQTMINKAHLFCKNQ